MPWCVLSSCERYPAYSVTNWTQYWMIPDQSASQRWFSEAPGLSLEALQDESDVKVANWKCHETQLILFSALKTNNEPWERNRNRKKQCVKQRTRVEGFSSTNGVREGSIEELTTWCLEGRPALKWPPTAFSLNFMPLQQFVQKALLDFWEENVTATRMKFSLTKMWLLFIIYLIFTIGNVLTLVCLFEELAKM